MVPSRHRWRSSRGQTKVSSLSASICGCGGGEVRLPFMTSQSTDGQRCTGAKGAFLVANCWLFWRTSEESAHVTQEITGRKHLETGSRKPMVPPDVRDSASTPPDRELKLRVSRSREGSGAAPLTQSPRGPTFFFSRCASIQLSPLSPTAPIHKYLHARRRTDRRDPTTLRGATSAAIPVGAVTTQRRTKQQCFHCDGSNCK